jgi:hypothetical protein
MQVRQRSGSRGRRTIELRSGTRWYRGPIGMREDPGYIWVVHVSDRLTTGENAHGYSNLHRG